MYRVTPRDTMALCLPGRRHSHDKASIERSLLQKNPGVPFFRKALRMRTARLLSSGRFFYGFLFVAEVACPMRLNKWRLLALWD